MFSCISVTIYEARIFLHQTGLYIYKLTGHYLQDYGVKKNERYEQLIADTEKCR